MRKYKPIPNPFPKPYEALWDMTGTAKLAVLRDAGWGEAEAKRYCDEMMQTWERERYGWGDFKWDKVEHPTEIARLDKPYGWSHKAERRCFDEAEHEWAAGPYLAWMHGSGGIVSRCGRCGFVQWQNEQSRWSDAPTGYMLDARIEDNWVHHRPDYRAVDMDVAAEDYGLTQEQQRERLKRGEYSWQISAAKAYAERLEAKRVRDEKNRKRREKARAKRVAERMQVAL